MPKISNNYCLNCKKSFVEDAEYCFACGQSKKASILSVKELWNNLWTTIFNVDNSFFTTLRLIARPDKLTRLYVAGKRKRHINPIRLFIISLVFFVAATFSTITIFENDRFLDRVNEDYYSSLMLEKYDEVVDGKGFDDIEYKKTQDIKEEVFKGVICADMDTVVNPKLIIDFGDNTFSSVTKDDLLNLTEEEGYEKYGITGYFHKVNFRSFMRINKNPNAAGEYLFTNSLWGLIPSILLLCLGLKLLYRHHKISYLEHLIFTANTHSFLFLFWMCVALFIKYFVEDRSGLDKIIPIGFLLNMIFVYLMMYLYYKEGILRTSVKYLLAICFYSFSTMVLVVVTTIISAFIF